MERKRLGVHKRGQFFINGVFLCYIGLVAWWYGIPRILAFFSLFVFCAIIFWIVASVLEKVVRD